MKPYGYVRADGSGIFIYGTDKFEPPQDVELVPVYLACEWVGLTEDEIWSAVSRIGTSKSDVNPYQTIADARAIEAKLKELNT